jgi:hypothetical protein
MRQVIYLLAQLSGQTYSERHWTATWQGVFDALPHLGHPSHPSPRRPRPPLAERGGWREIPFRHPVQGSAGVATLSREGGVCEGRGGYDELDAVFVVSPCMNAIPTRV